MAKVTSPHLSVSSELSAIQWTAASWLEILLNGLVPRGNELGSVLTTIVSQSMGTEYVRNRGCVLGGRRILWRNWWSSLGNVWGFFFSYLFKSAYSLFPTLISFPSLWLSSSKLKDQRRLLKFDYLSIHKGISFCMCLSVLKIKCGLLAGVCKNLGKFLFLLIFVPNLLL